ncbi:unnamed protein product [Eruca vesicaria subsp. sativa]|uniref:S-protein homolog n=1 Tax=Eruca vesicaria subsp. sativa TaxID=29727 RepID=A0ABC8L828_ERUVS|nr:unnamed protein product [Eruca vesicaria subsp. sativa]
MGVSESSYPKMNHLTICVLVIAICFCFKEGYGGCNPNFLIVRNQLGPDTILQVKCWTNRDEKTVQSSPVEFNKVYSTRVQEEGRKRIVWKCELRDPKNKGYMMIWHAYRGANFARCGQTREYIVDLTGATLVHNKKRTNEVHRWTKG